MSPAPSSRPNGADDVPTGKNVPGQHHLGPTVERFDDVADIALERLRGHPVLDRVFTTASHIGDFSLVWHTTNLILGIRQRRPRQVITFAVLIGLESLVVNQGVKRMFQRPRPTTAGNDGLHVRQPTTSSFPSGHASAATFAAGLLIPRSRWPWSGVIGTGAAAVAISRAYVRIHHASDVAAGLVTGAVLLLATRRVFARAGLDRLI